MQCNGCHSVENKSHRLKVREGTLLFILSLHANTLSGVYWKSGAPSHFTHSQHTSDLTF